jgi:hypothetical protein
METQAMKLNIDDLATKVRLLTEPSSQSHAASVNVDRESGLAWTVGIVSVTRQYVRNELAQRVPDAILAGFIVRAQCGLKTVYDVLIEDQHHRSAVTDTASLRKGSDDSQSIFGHVDELAVSVKKICKVVLEHLRWRSHGLP